MKKYISIALMAVTAFGFTSCDMESTNPSAMDADYVYTTPEFVESAIIASLNPLTGDGALRRITRYGGLNSDIEWCNGATKQNELTAKYNACEYNTDADNTELNKTSSGASSSYYAMLYKSIERTNTAIINLEKYMGTNAKLQELYGQALTLRAWYYFELVKYYGDVPFRLTETTSDNVYLPRTCQDSIMIRLLDDLKTAEEYVSWPNQSTYTQSCERVSLSFVKGLRARIALYACGYHLYNDNGTGNYRLSTSPALSEANMLKIAKEECIDVVNNHGSKLQDLSFETNFKTLCSAVDSHPAGQESIWEYPFSEGRGQLLYTYSPKCITNSADSDPHVKKAGVKYGGGANVMPTFYYNWDSRDTRRDITCVIYGNTDGVPDPANTSKVTSIYFGKYRYDWLGNKTTSSQDDGVNVQVMRLADIYLMAAEAINRLDNDQSAAWKYLDPVIKRSCATSLYNDLKTKYMSSQTAFQEGIVEQRAYEFAGEMLRKWDLIRWGILDTKISNVKTEMTALMNRTTSSLSGVDYGTLPEKLYYKVNGSTVSLYGLSFGDNDTDGQDKVDNEGYTGTKWLVDGTTGDPIITQDNIEGIATVAEPSKHCLWPIPLAIITSDKYLDNNFLGK